MTKRLLKILVINQYASTPNYSTGAGERFYYLSPWLKRHGVELEVVSGSYNHLFLHIPKVKKLFSKEVVDGRIFNWVKLSKYRNTSIGRVKSWVEFLIKLFFLPINRGSKPDLIIISSMSIFPVFYTWYIKKRFGIPFVLEVRDIWPLTLIHLGGYSKRNIFIKIFSWVERFAYRSSDEITSVLPGFSRHLQNLRIERSCYWIPNGINFSIQDEGHLSFPLPKGKFIIGYAGAMGVANALEHFIAAARLLVHETSIMFILVGEGPEKSKLERLAIGLNNVRFFPKVPKEQVGFFIQKIDAGFISWKKADIYRFGVSANKYNDYMMATKPILSASNIPDDPVKIAACGILANAEDPKDIADKVIKLYRMEEEERARLGKNGFNYVVQNQTYEVLSAKYMKLIQKVINKKGKIPPSTIWVMEKT